MDEDCSFSLSGDGSNWVQPRSPFRYFEFSSSSPTSEVVFDIGDPSSKASRGIFCLGNECLKLARNLVAGMVIGPKLVCPKASSFHF